MADLVDPDVAADPLALKQELADTRSVLLAFGGQAQGVFTWMATSEGTDMADFQRLKLSAFHRLVMDTRISQGAFREDNVLGCWRRFTAAVRGKETDLLRNEETHIDFQA